MHFYCNIMKLNNLIVLYFFKNDLKILSAENLLQSKIIIKKRGIMNKTVLCLIFLVGSLSADNLTCAQIDNKWGFTNEKGDFVIEAKFDRAYNFSETGSALVELNNKLVFIDKKGNVTSESNFNNSNYFAENGLTVSKNNNKWGFADKEGNFVIEPEFDRAYNFSEKGLAPVELNGKLVFINHKGVVVLKSKFNNTQSIKTK